MSITSEGMTPADIAAVTGNNRNDGGFGDGSGAWWLLVLFLFAANNGWNNGGWGGNGGGNNGAIPYIGTNADIQRGFDQSAIMSGINNLTTGQCNQTATLQNAITQSQIGAMQGFNGVTGTINNGVNLLQSTLMQNEMNRQQCCCDTKQAIADLKYTVATENCADRQALSDGIRDIIANNTAQTQVILDKMCQQEINAKDDIIANLRSQLNTQSLASQILADNSRQTAVLEDYLNPTARPAYIVQNPNTLCRIPTVALHRTIVELTAVVALLKEGLKWLNMPITQRKV